MPPSAHAELYTVPTGDAVTVESIRRAIEDEIPIVMQDATCGWVNTEEEVGETLGEGKIAKVYGLPGREGEPLGLPWSGMAKRSEEFLYPENATGFSTVCSVTGDGPTPNYTWIVWQDGNEGESGFFVPRELPDADADVPVLDDPLCNGTEHASREAGGEPGTMTPESCQNSCDWLNEFTFLDCKAFEDIPLEPDTPAPLPSENPEPEPELQNPQPNPEPEPVLENPLPNPGPDIILEIPLQNPEPEPLPVLQVPVQGEPSQPIRLEQTIRDEQSFLPSASRFLSQLIGKADAQNVTVSNPESPVPDGFIRKCAEWARRYTCSGQWVKEDVPEVTNEYPNCRVCTGEECRCPGPGCISNPEFRRDTFETSEPSGQEDDGLTKYTSFFRKYFGSTERQTLPETPDDQLATVGDRDVCESDDPSRESSCIVSACYGIYATETDWRDEKLTDDDRRCVIRFPLAMTRENLASTQENRNAYSPVLLEDDVPVNRPPSVVSDENPWEPVMGTMSFLKPETEDDLTTAILTREQSTLTALPAFTEETPLPAGNYERATDPTVDDLRDGGRFFTRWSQRLLTDIQAVLRPPTLHVRLPSLWNRFAPTTETGREDLPPVGSAENRTEPVDIQMRVGEGLIDDVAGLVTDVFTLREEEIPVTVPLNADELLMQWERYRGERKSRGLPVPSQVDTLIERLKTYRLQNDQVRSLRAQLPLYLTLVVARQSETITEVINGWVLENADRYEAILAAQDERLQLAPLAQEIAAEMLRFSDDVNTPWCRSTRWVVPNYAELDPWYPGRPALDGGLWSCEPTEDTLPLVCLTEKQRDMVYDLSTFTVQPGSLTVPTFTVSTVLLNLPSPPSEARQDIADTASLLIDPAWDSAVISWNERFAPTFEVLGDAPPLPPLPEFDPLTVRPSMERALEILQGRNKEREDHWESLRPSNDVQSLACPEYGSQPCMHPEFNQLESVMNAVARPNAVLREDLEATQDRRFADQDSEGAQTTWAIGCDPADHACQPLWGERIEPKDGWQVVRGEQTPGASPFDQLRDNLREEAFGNDGTADHPYRPDEEDQYRAFDRDPDTPLTPEL